MTPWCTAPLLTSCSCQQLIYGGQACHQKTEDTVTTSSCSTHSARRDLHCAFATPDLVIADRASSSSASSVVFTVLAAARGCTVGIIPCSDPIAQTAALANCTALGQGLLLDLGVNPPFRQYISAASELLPRLRTCYPRHHRRSRYAAVGCATLTAPQHRHAAFHPSQCLRL